MASHANSSRDQIIEKLDLNTNKFVEDLNENKRVDLSYKGVRGKDLLILCSFDRLPCTLSIKSLNLSFNNLGDEGATILAGNILNLVHIASLDVSFNSIRDDGVKAIAYALSATKTIRKLHLSGNLITSEGFKSVGQLLLNKSSILETLYLSCNGGHIHGAINIANCINREITLKCLCLNGNKINSEGCGVISKALLLSESIVHLNLSNNNIGDSGLLLLSKSLTSYQLLEVLELSFNGITENGMSIFANSLKCHHTLRRLALDNNKLGSGGATSLAAIFPSLMLQILDIGFNEIGPDGLDELIKSLIENVQFMTTFVLSGNVINAETSISLASWLVKNEVLKHLYLDRTSISPTGQRHIAAAIASNRMSKLENFTGFGLGLTLVTLGSPGTLLNYSNERILKYLKHCWATRLQSELLKKESAKENNFESNNDNNNNNNNNNEKKKNRNSSHVEDSPPLLNHDLLKKDKNITTMNQKLTLNCEKFKLPGDGDGVSFPNVDECIQELSTDLSSTIIENVKYLSLRSESWLSESKDYSSNLLARNSVVINRDLVTSFIDGFDYESEHKLLSKNVDVDYVKAVKSISQAPLNIAELWRLHQHFFSPPQDSNENNIENDQDVTAFVDTNSNNVSFDVSFDNNDDRHNDDCSNLQTFSDLHSVSNNDAYSTKDSKQQFKMSDKRNRTMSSSIDRPHKRHGNNNNMARISRFPKIREILEDVKRKPTSDIDTLLILRMLRYSENCYCDTRDSFSDVDVETLFFKMYEDR